MTQIAVMTHYLLRLTEIGRRTYVYPCTRHGVIRHPAPFGYRTVYEIRRIEAFSGLYGSE